MLYILILTLIVVVGTVTYGLVSSVRGDIEGKSKIKAKKALKINLASFIPVLCGAVVFMIPNIVHAAETGAKSGSGMGYIAAALSTGLACIGTGYAVGAVGSSALGAVSENPKILGKTLIYVGLAEGIAIYGLIISIMILGKL